MATFYHTDDHETISSGHTANLIYDDGSTRVWHERGTHMDGWKINYPLTLEHLIDGSWCTMGENLAEVEV